MRAPRGFEGHVKEGEVLKVRRGLYGCAVLNKEAPPDLKAGTVSLSQELYIELLADKFLAKTDQEPFIRDKIVKTPMCHLGHVVMMNNGPVSWSSTLMKTVARRELCDKWILRPSDMGE